MYLFIYFAEEPQLHIFVCDFLIAFVNMEFRNMGIKNTVQDLLVTNYTCKSDVSWSLEELSLFED